MNWLTRALICCNVPWYRMNSKRIFNGNDQSRMMNGTFWWSRWMDRLETFIYCLFLSKMIHLNDVNKINDDQCNGAYSKPMWAYELPITVCNNIYTWFHSLIRFSFLVKKNLYKRLNVLGNYKWRSISIQQFDEWKMRSSRMDPMICFPTVQSKIHSNNK